MSVHSYHPLNVSASTPVLFDNCERCDEHAEHPFESLDDHNIAAALKRYKRVIHDGERYLSSNERRACEIVGRAYQRFRQVGLIDRTVDEAIR